MGNPKISYYYTMADNWNWQISGEQSVGKSFALNHLVDTSFAGSAMRTTGRLWECIADPLLTQPSRGGLDVCNPHRRCFNSCLGL